MHFTDTLKTLAIILYLPLLLSLYGCQTASITSIDPFISLHDELFTDYQNINIESEQDVFALGEAARSFVDSKLNRFKDPDKQIKALANGIFAHSDLNLLYQNDANTVADETFINGTANCLSLTIMTYAMADYAGLGVQFQQVYIPDLWVRREGNSLLNRHVNLLLFPGEKINATLYKSKSFQLDFDQRARSLHTPARKVHKQRVLAMFYNNKGADALIKKDYSKAYAYFRKALTTDELLIEAWTNLGVLYSRMGQLEYAEQTYKSALSIDKSDTATMENLAHVYALTDRQDESKHILSRITKQRKSNPFYQFMLGEVEFEKQHWKSAIKHYQKAVSLNKKQHQFYHALAKAHSQLGNLEKSKRYLRLAKRYSFSEGQQLQYQGKLNRLHDLSKPVQ